MSASNISIKYRGKVDRAKDLFWKYRGAPRIGMSEQEDGEMYAYFDISKSQEREWALELFEEYFEKIANLKEDEDGSDAVVVCFTLIENYEFMSELSRLLDFFYSRHEDTQQFLCLLVSEMCLRYLEKKKFKNLTTQMMNTAGLLLQSAKMQAYRFPNGTSPRGYNLEIFSEEGIRGRIERDQIKLHKISE
jgi:hypothetical protein